jgi:hypothetical protein
MGHMIISAPPLSMRLLALLLEQAQSVPLGMVRQALRETDSQ